MARNTQKHLKVTILWRSVTHHSLGDNESVLKTYQCALDIKRKLFRKKHLETAASYYSLVVTQYTVGNYESDLESDQRSSMYQRACTSMYQRALVIKRKCFCEENSDTSTSYHFLMVTQYTVGNYESDLESDQRILDTRRKLFGVSMSVNSDYL